MNEQILQQPQAGVKITFQAGVKKDGGETAAKETRMSKKLYNE